MNILVAVTSYDGKITAECADSLLKNTHYLRDNGHNVIPLFHSGNVYIARARNICVYNFLRSDCDNMIFVDADVGFDADAMLKLIKHDKEIVVGVYPLKQENLVFPAVLKFDEVTNNCKEEETGLVTADMVPTGLMRIKRQVFEKMITHYKMSKDHEGVYSFFDTGMIFHGDVTWYGEDVAFCKRWKEMGGELFIEPNINFIHTGIKHYKGNLHEYLLGRRVTEEKAKEMVKNFDKQEGINGWTTEKELKLLGKLASESRDVVEIGSWKGRSTKALLDSCRGIVFAIDHWKGSPKEATGILIDCGQDIYKEFLDNVGHYPNLKVLKGSSMEMANTFNGKRVDMVFIDAGHSYKECKADIETWLPKCNKFICGHDYHSDFRGVVRAVDEAFGKVNVIDTLWWVNLEDVQP